MAPSLDSLVTQSTTAERGNPSRQIRPIIPAIPRIFEQRPKRNNGNAAIEPTNSVILEKAQCSSDEEHSTAPAQGMRVESSDVYEHTDIVQDNVVERGQNELELAQDLEGRLSSCISSA